MARLVQFLAAGAVMLAMAATSRGAPQAVAEPSRESVDEVWRIVNEHFFDPEFNGADWPKALERCRARCRDEHSSAGVVRHINAMLAELDASHTRFYRSDALEYYELLDIYRHALGEDLKRLYATGVVRYVGIGAVTRGGPNGRLLIVDAYDGGPAHAAGLRPGDEILFMNLLALLPLVHCGMHPWTLPRPMLPEAEGKSISCLVQRQAETMMEVVVTPQAIVPHELFLESMRRSARVIERDGQRLAYLRIRSWAGEEYQDLLIDLLNAEPLRSCDGLILDIRDGWGGANPDAIGVFSCDSPALELIARDGQRTVIASAPSPVPEEQQWRKPVTLLVDEGTRSGKEVFAYAFKENNRGTIVGARTAGAVLGGKPFLLNDGSLLIVAVTDVRVDGVRVEGVGVEPDMIVESDAMQTGVDAQLDRAAAALVDQIVADHDAPDATTGGNNHRHTPPSDDPAVIFPIVPQTRSTIIFTGRVQGVGFRATTESISQRFAVTGWVRNERDGSVLCVAEGDEAEVERFVAAIRQAMHAYIRDVQIARSPGTGEFSGFTVRH